LEYIRTLPFFATFVKDLGEVEEDALPEVIIIEKFSI